MGSRKKTESIDRVEFLKGNQPLTDFCEEIGLNYRALQKCFQRNTPPDMKSIAKIAAYYRANLNWLITGECTSSKLNIKVGKKLKLLRKKTGWSKKELGEKLKMSTKVLDFYENGTWPISADLLHDFAKSLNIPPQEFLQEGDSSPVQIPELKIFQTSSTKGAPKIRNEDYVSIPLTDSAIAAGQPIIQTDNIEDYVLLHIRSAGKRDNLVASRVDGDSMEPTLHSGDIVVIDRDDKKILKNKMYAIFYENGLTAKFVQRQKDLLILQPINPQAQVQIINLNEDPDPIVGRIVGAWKDF